LGRLNPKSLADWIPCCCQRRRPPAKRPAAAPHKSQAFRYRATGATNRRDGGALDWRLKDWVVASASTRAIACDPRVMLKMRRAIDPPQGRRRYCQRIGTVEPVFGNIRHKVNTQWHLHCMVHDIEKLANGGWQQ
jgi:hypothetical protein